MPRKTCTSPSLWPLRGLEEDRELRAALASPSDANDGIGEPGLTHDGHLRCVIWKSTPRFLLPIALRSGAPRLEAPTPR